MPWAEVKKPGREVATIDVNDNRLVVDPSVSIDAIIRLQVETDTHVDPTILLVAEESGDPTVMIVAANSSYYPVACTEFVGSIQWVTSPIE